jgi:polyisoprenoid-binding protein YceI
MNKFLTPIAAAVILAATAFTFAAPQNWTIADGYNISFSSNEAGGIFKTFKGSIAFDAQNPAASRFDVTIDVPSINTGNGLQNKHAVSDEWFDAKKYPTIRFTSKNTTKTGAGYQITGSLEMHGVQKDITFPFSFAQTSASGGIFSGAFMINRNDFKIGQPGGDVDDQIKVEIKVPVTK